MSPDLRESGYWRMGGDGIPGSVNQEVVELLLSHSSGVVEMYYGRALTQASWELATDVVIRSQSGALYGGAKRPVRHRRRRRPRVRRRADHV